MADLSGTRCPQSPAYENYSEPTVQDYCHIVTISTHPIAVTQQIGGLVSDGDGMCGDGNSMATVLDHRSTLHCIRHIF